MSELAKMVSSCGPMDILCMVTNKPKIEFDDLKKLDVIIALNPQIGVIAAY